MVSDTGFNSPLEQLLQYKRKVASYTTPPESWGRLWMLLKYSYHKGWIWKWTFYGKHWDFPNCMLLLNTQKNISLKRRNRSFIPERRNLLTTAHILPRCGPNGGLQRLIYRSILLPDGTKWLPEPAWASHRLGLGLVHSPETKFIRIAQDINS